MKYFIDIKIVKKFFFLCTVVVITIQKAALSLDFEYIVDENELAITAKNLCNNELPLCLKDIEELRKSYLNYLVLTDTNEQDVIELVNVKRDIVFNNFCLKLSRWATQKITLRQIAQLVTIKVFKI